MSSGTAESFRSDRALPHWRPSVVAPGRLAAVALLTAAALAGCDPNSRQQVSVATQPAMMGPASISVEMLAAGLGLELENASAYTAAMSDASNSLLLVGPPQGRALLNGRRLDQPDEIARRDGRLMVSEPLALRLRQSLRRAPAPAARPPEPPATSSAAPPATPTIDTQLPPALPPLAARARGTVVIDAGHGGKDPGTASPVTGKEKHLVLDVARRVRAALTARGVRVIMTRDSDKFLDLEERAKLANRAKADLFVSIHADFAANRQAQGYTVYLAEKPSARAIVLGRRLDSALRPAAIARRGVGRKDYRVLVLTEMPAALVEIGYVSNRAEAARLAQSAYRQKLAQAIANGIAATLQAGR